MRLPSRRQEAVAVALVEGKLGRKPEGPGMGGWERKIPRKLLYGMME
jgi:hypothetical protein